MVIRSPAARVPHRTRTLEHEGVSRGSEPPALPVGCTVNARPRMKRNRLGGRVRTNCERSS
jgi:hypothetical protein